MHKILIMTTQLYLLLFISKNRYFYFILGFMRIKLYIFIIYLNIFITLK